LNRGLVAVIRWIVALVMPVFIVLLWLWILWRPWFVRMEYNRPTFPPDRYGFTAEERLGLTLAWIEYYHSPESPEEGIDQLAALRFPGTDRPLHQPEELSHMIDVRRLTDTLWRVALPLSGLVVLGALAVLLIPWRTRRDGYAALFMGGVITTGLLLFFIMIVLLSFRTLFVTLHNVFFPPGTWTFDYSSTLIRLFPEQLWFDGGVWLVGGALVAGVLVLLAGHLLGRHSRFRT
jgi:integral membrane protein (TIGR01906 family)